MIFRWSKAHFRLAKALAQLNRRADAYEAMQKAHSLAPMQALFLGHLPELQFQMTSVKLFEFFLNKPKNSLKTIKKKIVQKQ